MTLQITLALRGCRIVQANRAPGLQAAGSICSSTGYSHLGVRIAAGSGVRNAGAPAAKGSGTVLTHIGEQVVVRMIRMAIGVTAALFFGAASTAECQDSIPEHLLARHAGHGDHGVGGIPQSLRTRIRASPAAIAFYADILEGKRQVSRSDTGTLLWWLAESGDPQYVPLLLEHATAETFKRSHSEFISAVYGLARHAATQPVAFDRLIQFAAMPSSIDAHWIAMVLVHVNDSASREILRLIPPGRLGSDLRPVVPAILAARALPTGEGRWPCPAGGMREKIDVDQYGCVCSEAP